ncbi:peptidoglycan binding domain-containing protein, partial [Vibrio parahaemolyticus]|nr:peptidoglycan binding domain-containing protein [Vibrio parahaemolyticus]
GFSIEPEVVGDAIDVEQTVTDLQKAITSGESELDLTAYQKKPSVTSDDKELAKEMESLNKIAQVNANYSINGSTFQIPTAGGGGGGGGGGGKTTIDEEKVRNYVADLGNQYNTSTNASTFKSTKQGEVSVPAGTLSWTIQTDSETSALIEALKTGEDFTRSPVVLGSADP